MKFTSIIALVFLFGESSAVNRRHHHHEAIQLERDPLVSEPARTNWAFKWGSDRDPGYPQDYFVPNFGMDKEIRNTQHSISDTEARLGHFWNIKLKPDPEPKRDYPVPDFGMDHDIITSLKNLNDQEKVHGAMSPLTY